MWLALTNSQANNKLAHANLLDFITIFIICQVNICMLYFKTAS